MNQVGLVLYSSDHVFLSKDINVLRKAFANKNVSFLDSRTSDTRLVSRKPCEESILVLNRLITDVDALARKQIKRAKECDHDNVERILNCVENDTFSFWTTIFYQDTIAAALKENRISNYDIDKMFHQIFDGLDYLKSKNIKHGHIHERNLAYDGKNWFIGGLVQPGKGSNQSTSGITSDNNCLRSRRQLKEKKTTSGDDMWQVILMFVRVVYGRNPFIFKGSDAKYNILLGNCQTFSDIEAGLLLREYLIRTTDIPSEEYEKIRGLCKTIIHQNNLTSNQC